jgi:Putative DNA-binding domain
MDSLDLPKNVDEWTFDTVVNIVRKYEFEPGQFDYKGILVLPRTDPTKDDYYASIRRTVCSMANADGGFILFGVSDRGQAVSSPDDRIVGIHLGGDLRKQFSEKISPIQRPVHFDASPKPIVLPTDSKRGIFIVQIPQSQLRPHMDTLTGAFYQRGEGGKADKMSFYEVRDQMLYTEGRLQKVRLLRLIIKQYLEQRQLLLSLGDDMDSSLLRFDTGAFNSILADVCELMPSSAHNLVEELLKIPFTANLVNEILSRSSYQGLQLRVPDAPDPRQQRRATMKQNLDALEQICTICEQELSRIFGPLYQV